AARAKFDRAAHLDALAGRRSRQNRPMRDAIFIEFGHGVDVTRDSARPAAPESRKGYRKCRGIQRIYAERCKTIPIPDIHISGQRLMITPDRSTRVDGELLTHDQAEKQ